MDFSINAPKSTPGPVFCAGPAKAYQYVIQPVFLPFAGCKNRCIYCAQNIQTGRRTGRDFGLSFSALQAELDQTLNRLTARPAAWELAFYGGTFTAMPDDQLKLCLDFCRQALDSGLICKARCSTRPDQVDPAVLARCKQAGISLIELGIQSFADPILQASGRGYSSEQAKQGCLAVHRAGLELGIQLLPGLPGSTSDLFLADVEQALALKPACLRFYPCLVLEGTPLAALWRAGRYLPWTLDQTIASLGQALALAWNQAVPVIRLALAPEPELDKAVLAGPSHPALGSSIQAEALKINVNAALNKLGRAPRSVTLPRHCQGFMYGQRACLKDWWNEHGLGPERVFFRQDGPARLE